MTIHSFVEAMFLRMIDEDPVTHAGHLLHDLQGVRSRQQ